MKNIVKTLTKRSDDYSQWYQDVIANADLAEHSVVRGCMVIKPYGYAIWEKIVAELVSSKSSKDINIFLARIIGDYEKKLIIR